MKPKAVLIDKIHLDEGEAEGDPEVTIVNPQPRQDGKVLVQVEEFKWVPEAHVKETSNAGNVGAFSHVGFESYRSKRRMHKPDYFTEGFKSPRGVATTRTTTLQNCATSNKVRDRYAGVNLISGFTFYNETEGELMEIPARNSSLSASRKRASISSSNTIKSIPSKRMKVSHEYDSDTSSINIVTDKEIESVKSKKNRTIWDLYNNQKFELVTQIQYLLEEEKLQPRATYLGEFFLFCNERQRIWYKRRMNEKKPWTECEVLDKRFFTNLYRELDNGTRFFHRAIVDLKLNKEPIIFAGSGDDVDVDDVELTEDDYFKNVLWMSICYRLVNKVETFIQYGKIPLVNEWKDFKRHLHQLKRKKDYKIFTPAHQVMGFDRYIETMEDLLQGKNKKIHELSHAILTASEERDLMKCTKIIQGIKNVGEFNAWQITCDLLESKVLGECTENQWVQLGPGAKSGLSYVFGAKCKLGDIRKMEILQQKQTAIFQFLPMYLDADNFADIAFDGRFLSFKELEHALCEFHKYLACCRSKGKGRRYNRPSSLKHDSVDLMCANCDQTLSTKPKKRVSCNTCTQEFCINCVGKKNRVSFMCVDCMTFISR